MTVCDCQRLGRTAGQGRRACGIPGHGPATAAAYPLRRRADTVNTGARLSSAGSTEAGIWRSCWRRHLTRPASTGALVCMPLDSSPCPMLARAAVGWCGAHILHIITLSVDLRPLAPQARLVMEARLYPLSSWRELLRPCDITTVIHGEVGPTSGISRPSSITWRRRTHRILGAHTSVCGPGSSGSYVVRFACPRRLVCTIS
jgi:hypothetical protein